MKKQKLIVVSMDAMIFEDLEYLARKPSFGWLLANCAKVEQVRCIYPTLTYPCHATMATGCWPAKHGVINNLRFAPGVENPDWLWFHDAYRVPDLCDACKKAGLTTAAVGWPTMGKHRNIDYLVGEIAGTKAQTEEEFHRDYELSGTSAELWEAVCKEHIHLRLAKNRIARSSYFNTKVCCEMIRKFQPDLTLLHTANIDAYRHAYGVHAREVEKCLDESEEMLTWLLDAIKDAGISDRTNLVITADHGQMDTTQTANPNVLLKENGFIETDENGEVKSWRAWSLSAGMSAEIFVKDPADKAAVYALLKENEGLCGYSRVYTREEAAKEGFGGPFSFVLETDDKSKFQNKWLGECVVPHPDGHIYGSHGFHPDKGPRPPIVAYGPAFQKGVVLKDASLIDGAPTWAEVMGVDLPDAEGRVLTELLQKKKG